MTVTSKIEIDILSPGKLPQISVSQGDYYSRKIEFTLLADGKPWKPPENAFIGLRYCKPDSTTGSYDTLPDGEQAWTCAGNLLTLTLAPQMLTAPGCVNAQIEIVAEDAILATFLFQIIVIQDPSRPVLQSKAYFNWQQWSHAQLDAHLEEAKQSGAFTGATPNLQIGTVTSLPAGSAATASIRGTTENPLLDLGIPQGVDPIVDDSLTRSGECADAKVTGDRLAEKANLIHRGAYTGNINTIGGNGLQINSVVWVGPGTGTLNLPYSEYGWCETWGATNEVYFQRITFTNNTICQRTYSSGAWSAWAWVTPPAEIGVEYRTAERFGANVVYTQTISCGTLVEGRKLVEVPAIGNYAVIRYCGYCFSSGSRYSIPSIYSSTSESTSVFATVNTTTTTGYIQLFAGASLSGYYANMQIWYTK